MGSHICKVLTLGVAAAMAVVAAGQTAVNSNVFVVGRATATDGLISDFHPTRVELPQTQMSQPGQKELLRMLLAEQGFAHRALPIGPPGLTLVANGRMTPDEDEMRKRLYEKGVCAEAGDRVYVTDLQVKPDRIIVDLNGGPYLKHRFLRHIQVNNMNVVQQDIGEQATGSRIILTFEGPVPDLTAAEVKSLLEPVIDFGAKTSVEAYAESLPPAIKDAVETHQVLVGMNRRMVLASLGQPESKLRERKPGDDGGEVFEEWIYGKTPQTIRFVRFRGDRVVNLEIAALGKPLEIHDKDEMPGYKPALATREIALGDHAPELENDGRSAPPSLRKDGEPAIAGSSTRVRVAPAPEKPRPDASSPDATTNR